MKRESRRLNRPQRAGRRRFLLWNVLTIMTALAWRHRWMKGQPTPRMVLRGREARFYRRID